MKNLFRIFSVLCVSVLLFLSGVATAQDLTIGNHTLISKQRVGRTYYNYTYKADVTNSGSDVQNVTANLTSNSFHTTVVDRDLSFGDVGSGCTVTSSDTFIIQQDRRYPLDWADLVWNMQFSAIPTEPVEFDEGDDIPELSQTIQPAGGTLTVNDPDSPIYGIEVTFPGGALPQETQVTIGYNTGSLSPNRGEHSGVNLIIETPGLKNFSQPVEITVPFNDPTGSSVPCPYYIEEDGSLSPVYLAAIDRVNGTFTFNTFHASLFTWIIDIFTDSPDTDTNFRSRDDGFRISNSGSIFSTSTGGECLGMSTFVQWYYKNKTSSEGDFYGKFYDILGQDAQGNNIRGEDAIATRAHISCHQYNTFYVGIFSQQMRTSAEDRYAVIKNAIINRLNPALIRLGSTTRGGGHAVLAYGFDDDDGQLFIYDPNNPADTSEIIYDKQQKIFNNYTSYPWDQIALAGNGTLRLQESYESILRDAKADFHSSTMPVINITSHVSGATVQTHNITLIGTILSVEVLVDKLEVIIGSNKFSGSVNVNGNFSIPLTLSSGVNRLKFATYGKNPIGVEIPVTPTNMDTQNFTIDLVIPASMILMTLTWDKNDTDLDTYVIDPTGDYSSYYHMNTSDGGELDRDDVDGFGPEHWTLMNTDTVRYNQPYRFRVHYYSDHGNGGTNYTVNIKLYEGTSRETTQTYSGYLGVSSPSNSAPNDSGSDWVDIANVILTPETTSSTLRTLAMPMATISKQQDNGEIFINIPVPPIEERIKSD